MKNLGLKIFFTLFILCAMVSVFAACESHTHTPVVDEAVEPTCTEEGLTEGAHCSVCNEVLVAQKNGISDKP